MRNWQDWSWSIRRTGRSRWTWSPGTWTCQNSHWTHHQAGHAGCVFDALVHGGGAAPVAVWRLVVLHHPVVTTQEHNIVRSDTNLNPWVIWQGFTNNSGDNVFEESRWEYTSFANSKGHWNTPTFPALHLRWPKTCWRELVGSSCCPVLVLDALYEPPPWLPCLSPCTMGAQFGIIHHVKLCINEERIDPLPFRLTIRTAFRRGSFSLVFTATTRSEFLGHIFNIHQRAAFEKPILEQIPCRHNIFYCSLVQRM